jgi:hypothetical protein
VTTEDVPMQDLDRHRLAELLVRRLEDGRHPAASEDAIDSVFPSKDRAGD